LWKFSDRDRSIPPAHPFILSRKRLMATSDNLQEWLFVAGYVSFLVFIVWGVMVSSSRQD